MTFLRLVSSNKWQSRADDNEKANFELIETMSVLQDIFANVRYEEVSPLFDEMETIPTRKK